MTKEELKQAYIHGNLSKGVVHCDKESVSAGLEKLTELISLAEKADENSNQAINNLQNLNGFYGVVKNNCLAEDNLLYDLDIPSYGGSNTEEIVNDFKKDTEELKQLMTSLKKDIEATVSAIDVYNNRDAYSPGQLAAAAEGISLFDDYARLGEYANKYTLDQFNGKGGSGNKVSGYSGGGGGNSNNKINTDAFEKKEITQIPTHSPTPITTQPTPTKSTTNPIPTSTKPAEPTPTHTITVNPIKTTTTPRNTNTRDDGYVPPVNPGIPGDGDRKPLDFSDDSKDKEDKIKAAAGVGTLASSITTANLRKEKVKKLDQPINSNDTKTENNYIIPTAAALSASAAAGIGTKAYIDYSNNNWRKEDDDDDEEKKDEIESEDWNGSEDDMNVEYGIKDSTEIIEELEDDDEKPSDNFNFVDE